MYSTVNIDFICSIIKRVSFQDNVNFKKLKDIKKYNEYSDSCQYIVVMKYKKKISNTISYIFGITFRQTQLLSVPCQHL